MMVMEDMLKDFLLGEHLLLVGNQVSDPITTQHPRLTVLVRSLLLVGNQVRDLSQRSPPSASCFGLKKGVIGNKQRVLKSIIILLYKVGN